MLAALHARLRAARSDTRRARPRADPRVPRARHVGARRHRVRGDCRQSDVHAVGGCARLCALPRSIPLRAAARTAAPGLAVVASAAAAAAVLVARAAAAARGRGAACSGHQDGPRNRRQLTDMQLSACLKLASISVVQSQLSSMWSYRLWRVIMIAGIDDHVTCCTVMCVTEDAHCLCVAASAGPVMI